MPYNKFYLGIDIGTTSVKAALVDEEGKAISQAMQEYPIIHIKPLWVEQSPYDWWNATVSAVKKVMSNNANLAENICGIGVTGLSPSYMGIDEKGEPVGNALIWMDRRAQDICDDVLSKHAAHIREICGNRVDPYYVLPKLLWTRKYNPEAEKRTHTYLQANEWIIFCLTGKTCLERTYLGHLQIYNIFKDCWDEENISRFEIDISRFPPIYSSGDCVGTVNKKAAEQLGIPYDIPVAAGCSDSSSVAVGLNHTEPGCMFEMSGQSSGIGVVIDKPIPSERLNLSCGALADRWTLKGSMSNSGGSLRWFRDVVDNRADDPNAYLEYDMLAQKSPPGANGVIFLPYLSGERAPLWDSDVSGIFFGIRTSTTKGDLIRAILEGTAFGLYSILCEFPKDINTASFLYGTGGGYKSAVWSQMKADVLGKEIRVQRMDYDAACAGAAYLAMCASGNKKEMKSPEVEAIYCPDPSRTEFYRSRHKIFTDIYQYNTELFKRNKC